MIHLKEIDNHIFHLLDYLESIQNEDGGFDRKRIVSGFYKQEDWHHSHTNTHFDTAIPLIPLCFMNDSKSAKIVQNGINKIKKRNLDNFLWSWADSKPVPYCTDDTSFCSYVLEKNGFEIDNKNFLNEFIDENQHYLFFILPQKKSKNIRLLTYIKLVLQRKKILNSINFLDDQMVESDHEFSSTCINLLYLNRMESNIKVWEKIKMQFSSGNLDHTYYIDIYHSFYHYARLFYYGNHKDLLPETDRLDQYINQLYAGLGEISNSPRHILFANSLLFLGVCLESHSGLINKCMEMLTELDYKNHMVYYSSHNIRPLRSNEKKPFVYFGSSAINCSLYIEFLNIYRKRNFGLYYGNNS